MASISAIVVNFNHADRIEQCLYGIKNQIIPFDEVIIVDDGSTDNSRGIIQRYCDSNLKFRLLSLEDNSGVNSAIRAGLEKCSSDFFFLASSTVSYNDCIVSEFKRLTDLHPKAKMIAGNAISEKSGVQSYHKLIFNDSELVYPAMIMKKLENRLFSFLGGANIIHTQTVIQEGLFDEKLRWHADWYLYMSVGFRHPVAVSSSFFAEIVARDDNYSSGMHNSSEQSMVTRHFLNKLENDHCDLRAKFENSCLLPFYSFSTFKLVCSDKRWHSFISVRLLMMCLFYWPMKKIFKTHMPYPIKLLRILFKI